MLCIRKDTAYTHKYTGNPKWLPTHICLEVLVLPPHRQLQQSKGKFCILLLHTIHKNQPDSVCCLIVHCCSSTVRTSTKHCMPCVKAACVYTITLLS